MNIRTMKYIDETFGPIVCFILFWYNLAKRPFVRNYALVPEKVKNILLIKFFGMGSIVLAGPLLRALKAGFPNAKILVLTFPGNREICARIKEIDEVVTLDSGSFLKAVWTMLKAIALLRKKRCEISIDLEFFAKSSTVIQYMCGARIRVGYFIIQFGILLRMLWRGNLLTHNVYYNPHRHVSEVFLALGRKIGVDTDDMSPATIKTDENDRRNLNSLLSNLGIQQDDSLVVMNINASSLCLERRWPADRFAELTGKILSSFNIKIILIGDTHDTPYVDGFLGMVRRDPKVINLTGKLDIGMLAVLLERARLLITNDSGPLHIAASIGTPTVSLFGPEIPERYGPIGEKHGVLYSRAYCSPCLNVYNQKIAMCNGENRCMQAISVEDVFTEAAKNINTADFNKG
ncbi:MAG: glycosyltransferase family 9 protein [Candidatus Omnitrophica bacterium]|nr:glycosyltransferase family 9 protein [Candidatus Omnitrophota bacterium]